MPLAQLVLRVRVLLLLRRGTAEPLRVVVVVLLLLLLSLGRGRILRLLSLRLGELAGRSAQGGAFLVVASEDAAGRVAEVVRADVGVACKNKLVETRAHQERSSRIW